MVELVERKPYLTTPSFTDSITIGLPWQTQAEAVVISAMSSYCADLSQLGNGEVTPEIRAALLSRFEHLTTVTNHLADRGERIRTPVRSAFAKTFNKGIPISPV